MSDVKVEQRHRDAAADALQAENRGNPADYRKMRDGLRDADTLVQAFAHFERDNLTAQAARLEAAEAMSEQLATALRPFSVCGLRNADSGYMLTGISTDELNAVNKALAAYRTFDGAGR